MEAQAEGINTLLYDQNYSGVVCLSGPRISFYESYDGGKEGISKTSIFPIASVTKIFTSALILSELEKKKISHNMDVRHLFPDLPIFLTGITFFDLLSHQSGMGVYTDFNAPQQERSCPLSDEDFFHLSTLKTTKKGRFSYNNGNYIVLEKILEKLTGQSFSKNLEEKILNPLNMRSTGLLERTQISPFVRGKTKNNALALSIHYSWLGGGAGMYSTAADLLAFSGAILERKVLSQKILQLAWTENDGRYGLGWSMDRIREKKILFHEGGIDGFSTMMMLDPSSSSILVMLSNQEINIEDLSKKVFLLFF